MWECTHSVQYCGPFIQEPLDIGLCQIRRSLPPHLCSEWENRWRMSAVRLHACVPCPTPPQHCMKQISTHILTRGESVQRHSVQSNELKLSLLGNLHVFLFLPATWFAPSRTSDKFKRVVSCLFCRQTHCFLKMRTLVSPVYMRDLICVTILTQTMIFPQSLQR